MKPTLGRIVEYTLTGTDVMEVNSQRAVHENVGGHRPRDVGNAPTLGQKCPMVIVRTWGGTEQSAVNGQVLLDGNDSLWVTSRSQGPGEGQWRPFERVEA